MQKVKRPTLRRTVVGCFIALASCLLPYGLICYITIDALVTLDKSATQATLDGNPIADNKVTFHPIKGTYRLEFERSGKHRIILIHPLVTPWNPVSDSIYLHVEPNRIEASIPYEEVSTP